MSDIFFGCLHVSDSDCGTFSTFASSFGTWHPALGMYLTLRNSIKMRKSISPAKVAKSANQAKNASHEAKNTFLCVDLKFEGNKSVIRPKQTRQGSLTCIDDDRFHFAERNVPGVPHPHLHWRLLDRTLHGRASVNAQHVKVEFYIHHDEYLNSRDLADILASEMETIGENLCDINLEEEVAKCY